MLRDRVGQGLKTLIVLFILSSTAFLYAADNPTNPAMPLEKIDINVADAEMIAQAMDGVGMVKAQEIVAYREMNGKFQSIDQLTEVKGIGIATVEKNRHRLLVLTN
jgi:competence protein ComEA